MLPAGIASASSRSDCEFYLCASRVFAGFHREIRNARIPQVEIHDSHLYQCPVGHKKRSVTGAASNEWCSSCAGVVQPEGDCMGVDLVVPLTACASHYAEQKGATEDC
jgi:hypothetical protein